MITDAYRKYLAQARVSLQQVVAEIASRVPGELSRAPTLDLTLRAARSEAAEALARYPHAWALGFEESLAELVETQLAPKRSPRLDLDSLGIMDDDRVQEEIEVVNAARTLADDAGAPLHRLRWLESVLQVESEPQGTSPVDPASIARLLWRATEHLPLSLPARSEAVRSAVRLAGARLGPLYRELVAATEEAEGIAPSARAVPTPVRPDPGQAPRRADQRPAAGAARGRAEDGARFDVTRPSALMALLDVRARPEPPPDFLLTQPLALEGDGSKLPRLIHHHRDGLAQLGSEGADGAAASLIGRIFDEIRADPTLGAEAATWIGRLQPAVLKLASEDAGVLHSHRHPAWALINQLATLFNEDAARRPPNLDAWLARVVQALVASPRHERFEAFNRKLSAWRSAQAQSRLTEMAPAVEFLRRHSQLEHGVEAVRKRLERRLNASRADEAVRRFVASVWALVCAHEAAAEASPAAGVPGAWDTATDLIWSASPARSRLDGPTLVQMIPALVDRLKDGMGRLGLDPAVQQAWLERLSALHLRALRRSPEEAQTDLPLTIDLALEDEPSSLREWIDSQIEAAAPARPEPEGDPVAALEIGQRLPMQVQGEWVEVALVWRSDNGHFLLFSVPEGGTLSVTWRSLQRLLDEGLAQLPDAGGALARAARRIADAP
jgi:hypothetical protein